MQVENQGAGTEGGAGGCYVSVLPAPFLLSSGLWPDHDPWPWSVPLCQDPKTNVAWML